MHAAVDIALPVQVPPDLAPHADRSEFADSSKDDLKPQHALDRDDKFQRGHPQHLRLRRRETRLHRFSFLGGMRRREFCEHGRRRYDCKECGGAGICDHGSLRHFCIDCGGASLCTHGRRRRSCAECGGAAICPHGRQRYTCRPCGGAGICLHGLQRYYCKECGGAGICDHGRRRRICLQCGGQDICNHGRRRRVCVECRGKDICQHLRQRYTCKACGGKGICTHGRRRATCKECERMRSGGEADLPVSAFAEFRVGEPSPTSAKQAPIPRLCVARVAQHTHERLSAPDSTSRLSVRFKRKRFVRGLLAAPPQKRFPVLILPHVRGRARSQTQPSGPEARLIRMACHDARRTWCF